MCNPYENSKEYFKAEMKVISSEERALELICSRRQWGAIVFTEQGPEWKYNGGTRSLTQIMGQSYIMPFFKITMNIIMIFDGKTPVIIYNEKEKKYEKYNGGVDIRPNMLSYLRELLGENGVVLK